MIKPVLRVIATGWLALSLVFIGLRLLPGDAIQAQAAEAGLGTPEIEQRRTELGLDLPLIEQYFRYLGDLLRGNLGRSLYTGERVVDVIRDRAGSTLVLAANGLMFMMVTAVVLAAGAARSGWLSSAAQALIAIAIGLPSYVTGTLLILAVGLADPDDIKGILAASFILGFHSGGVVAQVFAISIEQIRRQAYIVAAYGRGLPLARVEQRHVWPNAILPVLSLAAVQAGFLLSGTVITEIVFARPGLGRLMLDAVQRRDLPVVQSLVLLAALVYGICLLAAEFLNRVIDPRPVS